MFQLLVGLGNPGAEYEDTRHNAGFWWIDEMAHLLKVSFQADRSHHGWVAKAQWHGKPVWLLKPSTFMNRSGLSVGSLARFYKIPPSSVLVAHDELDLPPGDIRIKQAGGHAGHNGLRDIHAQLGSADYWRLRIGIGHPGDKSEVAAWVLKKPPRDQWDAIHVAIDRALAAHSLLLDGQMADATKAIHTSQPERAKPARPPQIS
ncbi:MAG: hypothetical protein RLZZ397_1409 [Pseudomonadota bacterium]|jgi:PTH1 family peptidyl-tRNA hydrolase